MCVTAAMAVTTAVPVFAASDESWCKYDYSSAFMKHKCSKELNGATFNGIMGLFANTPHGYVRIESGSSSGAKASKYVTTAECTYDDSSGNTQTLTKTCTTDMQFNATGAGQMFKTIVCTHYFEYNGGKVVGLTRHG